MGRRPDRGPGGTRRYFLAFFAAGFFAAADFFAGAPFEAAAFPPVFFVAGIRSSMNIPNCR